MLQQKYLTHVAALLLQDVRTVIEEVVQVYAYPVSLLPLLPLHSACKHALYCKQLAAVCSTVSYLQRVYYVQDVLSHPCHVQDPLLLFCLLQGVSMHKKRAASWHFDDTLHVHPTPQQLV